MTITLCSIQFTVAFLHTHMGSKQVTPFIIEDTLDNYCHEILVSSRNSASITNTTIHSLLLEDQSKKLICYRVIVVLTIRPILIIYKVLTAPRYLVTVLFISAHYLKADPPLCNDECLQYFIRPIQSGIRQCWDGITIVSG